MFIADSNQIFGVVPSLNTVSNTTDDLENVTNEQFAYNVNTSNSDDIEFDFGAVSAVEYVAIHGLFPLTKVETTVSVKINGIEQDSAIAKYYNNTVVFCFIDSPKTGNLAVRLSGPSNKSVAYIAAGTGTNLFSGIQGGQVYNYLQNNFESSNTMNKNAAPTSHIIRQVAPMVTVNIPNELYSETFIQDKLFNIYDLSNTIGIVSMLDFETGVNYNPLRGWFGFGLMPTKVTADPRLNRLNSISMQFKAGQ